MKTLTDSRAVRTARWLGLLLAMSSPVMAAVPDLTATGVIATIDKSLSYNLGPTGLRGWIYNSGDGSLFSPQEGYISALSRQILVTVVGTATPASGVLAADDVILGVGWGPGGDPVPLFTSDARKSFGWAIGEAEKTANSGILKLKRWRGGVTTDVSITLPVMGSYTDTAPFNCPKSALILANAINVLKNESFENNFGGPISALALMAGVVPGDPDYAAVRNKLQIYARSLAPGSLSLTGCTPWDWGYINLFLCEYYLRGVVDGNPDASVLHGINEYTVALAKGQGMFGTYGHGGSILRPDGSLHGSIPWYGPVNAAASPPISPSSWAKRRCWPAASRWIRKSIRPSNAAPCFSVTMSTRDRFPTANMSRGRGTTHPTARTRWPLCCSACRTTGPWKRSISPA